MFIIGIFRDIIGLTVLELLEKGELQKLHKKWWFDKGECVVDDMKVPYHDFCVRVHCCRHPAHSTALPTAACI